MVQTLYKKQGRMCEMIHLPFTVRDTDWWVQYMAPLLFGHLNQRFSYKNNKIKECLVIYYLQSHFTFYTD